MRSEHPRFLIASLMLVAAGLAGCSTASPSIEATGMAATETIATGGMSAQALPVSGGVAVASLTPDGDERAYGLFGPWTLARSGSPGCTVDLGSVNSVGEYTARTRRCTSIDLARIALWKPTGDGLVLYDFERRAVVQLQPKGAGLYEGQLWDGTRITLFR